MCKRAIRSATPHYIWRRMGPAKSSAALLEAGADLEVRDEDGSTALHGAAGGGAVEAVMTLLEVGVDLEARNLDGSTPLHLAARDGVAEVVMTLLEAGADPGARNNDGKQPFEYARDNEQLQGTGLYWMLRQAGLQ